MTLLVGSEFSYTAPGIVPWTSLVPAPEAHRALPPPAAAQDRPSAPPAAHHSRDHRAAPLRRLVTYSAAAWEHVEWSLFDLVGVSFYRSGRNHTTYADRLRTLVRDHDKRVVITEFGCGAFTGADQRGAGSFWIVNWFAVPPRIRGDHPLDESVQARYLGELINQHVDAEGVHGCFVFTFAMPDFPRHDDPRGLDIDKAGFGVDGGDRRRCVQTQGGVPRGRAALRRPWRNDRVSGAARHATPYS